LADLLELVQLDGLALWLSIVVALAGIAVIPRFFGLNRVNALAFAQVTLAFNVVIMLAGWDSHEVSGYSIVHFFATEYAFLCFTCAAYRPIIARRRQVNAAFATFFAGRGGTWTAGLMVAIVAFNYAIAPSDGSSRIAYMTSGWFSLVRPVVQLTTPMAYVGILVMLTLPRRRTLGFVLLLLSIGASILSGSKASFLFGLAMAALLLRDLSGSGRLEVRAADRWKIAAVAIPMALYALARLEVTPADVLDRFFLFGEANILTYFSDRPTEACEGVSTFASMHRGLARALGDASANDIDTLFGFALTKLHVGINTFTGPNGRLSAYMICNFPGVQMVLGWVVVAVYFALLALLRRRILNRPLQLAAVLPYLVTSLNNASQDFNLIMGDITLACLLLLLTVPLIRRQRRYSLG